MILKENGKWIEFQMASDITWDNFGIDHVKPICMFDISIEEELKDAFNWKNTQPLSKQDLQQKRSNYMFFKSSITLS